LLKCETTYCYLPFLVALLSFFMPVAVFSQVGYQFENYTVDNGLSDNRITSFLKDRNGFIWIGTENGLNRFDGQRFLFYTRGGERNISNAYINDLAQDNSGKIWVATQIGLNVIDPDTDSVAIFLSEEGNKKKSDKTISSDLIWDIYIDKYNRIWMAPDGKNLCYYDLSKKAFNHFPWKDFIEKKFPHRTGRYNSIRRIYYKSEHELWLGTTSGLCSYNTLTGTFSYYNSIECDHFLQLENACDSSAAYFTQNPSQGLQTVLLRDHKVQTIDWNTIPPARENRISASNMKYMRWLPSGTGDLIEINTATHQLSLITHRVDDPHSLPPGIVRTVYTDSSGVVWVGTTLGVGKFSPLLNPFAFNPVFPSLLRKIAPEKDLYPLDNIVHTVFYSKRDHQYFISSPANNCLVIIDGSTNRSRIVTDIQGIPLKQCSVIFEDSHGMLWILANNRAFLYNRDTKEFQVTAFQAAARNFFIADMAEDDQGDYWFSCFNDGLYWYNHKTQTQKRITSLPKQESVLPTGLYFDKKRRKLWIGTFGNGLFQYNFNNKTFLSFFAVKKATGTLNTTLITDITGDRDSIWIATSAGGISKCAAANEQINGFRTITTAHGLSDNSIYTLQTDLNENVWATSFKGLTKINSTTSVIENFTKKNGLFFTDFYSPLSITFDGHLLTGIQNGFLMFHPDSLQQDSSPFFLTITSFKTDKLYEYRKQYLEKKITQPYTSDEAEFSFAALTYYYPKETRFEYQLEGINKEWINNANTDNVKYNNLPPGNYHFKVRAYDFSGKRSFNEAILSFEILPPWWQTWWIRTIGMLTIGGLIMLVYFRRVRAIKKKAVLQYQISSLKEQALRSQMNPHFIFNCLNAIQELIITENYTASFEYLSKFSKLLRLVLHASEKNLLPLSKEIEITHLYIELESLRFKNQFQYNISFSGEIDIDNTPFPTLLLQPFVENAIWHGLLHKEGLKKLDIAFIEQDSSLVCTIKDNGIGRDHAQTIKRKKIGFHNSESKGIKMATQRLEILKLTKECSGGIAINDVMETDGSTGGTIVEIIIIPNEKI